MVPLAAPAEHEEPPSARTPAAGADDAAAARPPLKFAMTAARPYKFQKPKPVEPATYWAYNGDSDDNKAPATLRPPEDVPGIDDDDEASAKRPRPAPAARAKREAPAAGAADDAAARPPRVLAISMRRGGYRLASFDGRAIPAPAARNGDKRAKRAAAPPPAPMDDDDDGSDGDDGLPLRPYDTAEARALFAALDRGRVPAPLRHFADPSTGLLRVNVRDSRTPKIVRKSTLVARLDAGTLAAAAAKRERAVADAAAPPEPRPAAAATVQERARAAQVDRYLEKKKVRAMLHRARAIEKDLAVADAPALETRARPLAAGPPGGRLAPPLAAYRHLSLETALEEDDAPTGGPPPPGLALLEARSRGAPGDGDGEGALDRTWDGDEAPGAAAVAQAMAREAEAQRRRAKYLPRSDEDPSEYCLRDKHRGGDAPAPAPAPAAPAETAGAPRRAVVEDRAYGAWRGDAPRDVDGRSDVAAVLERLRLITDVAGPYMARERAALADPLAVPMDEA